MPIGVVAAALFATPAMAINVANQTDWNTAVAAVGAAGSGATVTINFTGDFTLTSSLAALVVTNTGVTVNIVGAGHTIDGASAFQGMVVIGSNSPTVTVSNLTVANSLARGNNGTDGQAGYFSNALSYGSGGGGGGGLGAGGGLYVDSNANVTLTSVSFTNTSARGGTGGNGGSAQNTAADPVNGGNGGNGGAANGGGASGGGGTGGTGGHSNPFQGTGGNPGPATGDGGGGAGGSGTTSGDYSSNNTAGSGNNGGGSGGGGGDGATNHSGAPGADGGRGGNGGGARGGAIFVAAGGTLVVNDSPITNATLTAGSGGTGGSGGGSGGVTGNNGGAGVTSGQNLYLAANATIAVDATTTPGGLTYSGTISGTAGIAKSGTGTLTLSAANDYGGTTSITGGTLQLSGGTNRLPVSTAVSLSNAAVLDLNGQNQTIAALSSASATSSITLGSATLSVNQSTNTTFAGGVSGSGGLTKLGVGTLLLSGNNTYSGATTVSAGTLQLSGGNAIGDSSNVTMANVASAKLDLNGSSETIGSLAGGGNTGGNVLLGSGTLTTGNSVNTTYSGAISGVGGSLTKVGTDILILNHANTYTGTTTVSAGILRAGIAGALASNTVFVVNGGTLDLNNFALTANSLSGSGGAVSLGTAALTAGGDNASTTFSGAFSGGAASSLTKTGTGTWTLGGSSAGFQGSTTIGGGVLKVTGAMGSTDLAVNAGAGLTIDSTGSYVLQGTLTNNGTASVAAGGQLNALVGGVTSVGTIDNSGTINAAVNVTAGSVGGAGTFGSLTVGGGANFIAGNGAAGSSTTITGNLALQSGALYFVQINPVTSSFTSVGGTATLGGATLTAIYANGTYVNKQYTVVSAAGGLSGTFAGTVNTNLPSGFSSALSYDVTHAYLNLTLNFGLPGGLNGNQQNVGNALGNFLNNTGSIPIVYGALTPAGLSQAAGETGTGSQQTTFSAMTQFLGSLLDPFIGGRGGEGMSANAASFAEQDGASAYAASARGRTGTARDAYGMMTKAAPRAQAFEARWSVWASGFSGSQTTDGNGMAGSNSATSRVAGTTAGADFAFSPQTIAGFALAGGGTSFSVANNGSGRSDLFQAGAFLKHTVGSAYISGAAAYGWQDVTTDRTVTIAGVDRLRAEFNANAWSGRIEGGYRFVAPWIGGVGMTPYAAGQFTTFDLPAYAESIVVGTGNFALAYGAKSVTDTRSELGIRTDKSYAMPNAMLTLRGRFGWAHDFNADRAAAATFQALPGASFIVNGATPARDSALTTASVEMKWIDGWSAAATFEGEFSAVTRSYAGKGAVRYAW
jgi:autotransporter-associated beta strand protein